jgi:hypothetical protein
MSGSTRRNQLSTSGKTNLFDRCRRPTSQQSVAFNGFKEMTSRLREGLITQKFHAICRLGMLLAADVHEFALPKGALISLKKFIKDV